MDEQIQSTPMDEQIQSTPPTDPGLTDLTSRHESSSAEIDPMDVALLFNKVGSELTQIDKQSVGSGGPTAMQLTEKDVFNGINRNSPPSQPHRSPPPPPNSIVNKPVLPPLQRPPLPNPVNDKRLEALEKKFKKLESFSRAYNNVKKIKRGVTYSVSSNSMKGEIKDASVLLEYVMCEINKGVKTISIKISED